MRVLPRIACILVCTVSIAQAAEPQAAEPQADKAPKRAILVTGASTGIGRATAELLAKNGFFVYAGARKAEDIQALSAIENIEGIRLDVTKQAEIDAAVKRVQEAGRGLFGIVNNAGVVVLGPMIEMKEEDLAFQFDVNVFGPYRVTKAFAPLLIDSKGRVATIGSISGHVTGGMSGAYTMSKHAMEAYSETLSLELAPFDVKACVIEPGGYRSEIFKNTRDRLDRAGVTGENSRYAEYWKAFLAAPDDREQYKQPDEVASAVMKFFTTESPARRAMVVPDRNEAELTLKAAMRRVVDLNAAQPYELDREALIQMLDEVLANR